MPRVDVLEDLVPSKARLEALFHPRPFLFGIIVASATGHGLGLTPPGIEFGAMKFEQGLAFVHAASFLGKVFVARLRGEVVHASELPLVIVIGRVGGANLIIDLVLDFEVGLVYPTQPRFQGKGAILDPPQHAPVLHDLHRFQIDNVVVFLWDRSTGADVGVVERRNGGPGRMRVGVVVARSGPGQGRVAVFDVEPCLAHATNDVLVRLFVQVRFDLFPVYNRNCKRRQFSASQKAERLRTKLLAPSISSILPRSASCLPCSSSLPLPGLSHVGCAFPFAFSSPTVASPPLPSSRATTSNSVPSTDPHPRPSLSSPSPSSASSISRLELLASLDAIIWILFVHSYLVSPSHLLTFLLRLFSHIQFSSSRKIHPARSLRHLLTVWFFVNASSVIVHAWQGSRGTKGTKRWSSTGLIVDFVGQAITPSKSHLVLLDLLIALSQFVLIILVFADPDWRSAVERTEENEEIGRDYTALLGEEWAENVQADGEGLEEEQQQGEDLTSSTIRRRRRRRRKRRTHHSSDSSKYSSLPTTLPHSRPSPRTFDSPMFEINLQNLVEELRRSNKVDREEEEEDGLVDLEEGRG
ncbi:BZ3500_MvSof-1268-A1-R1_Chr2-3g05294 [Microbotryum saponariae]|uniref:BZ3500_MvSof-1268-A1-R1_Chr2-3g05294 protein n=1 Tax=Microbotryum saponariae TaxID=289078 RepID=A0A2X0LX97_9BASI|nr:BZ3500_MvSof-1268-A1-R1_Chr2-3g05294 [Microbotryum saponariae]SDA01135.1 BZ3501_MvSof-1269-A2-R1_Chr2-2g04967 [Microbotryum saponariae]